MPHSLISPFILLVTASTLMELTFSLPKISWFKIPPYTVVNQPCFHFMCMNQISMLHGFKMITTCSIVILKRWWLYCHQWWLLSHQCYWNCLWTRPWNKVCLCKYLMELSHTCTWHHTVNVQSVSFVTPKFNKPRSLKHEQINQHGKPG